MKYPESPLTCGMYLWYNDYVRKRERGKNMWTVFNKVTGKVVKEGLACEVDCEMWIAAQANNEELAYAPF